MKRLLNYLASDYATANRDALVQAIRASEGRTILSENVTSVMPVVPDITNAEVARSFGADLILLNTLDVLHPEIPGLDACDQPIQRLKELTGRAIGVNLEPIDLSVDLLEERQAIVTGRQVTEETLIAAQRLEFDFICITGNPGTGVTNATIIAAIEQARRLFDGMIIAGKMHGAGSQDPIYDEQALLDFAQAGADVILLPAPGTVPGSDLARCGAIVSSLKQRGVLVMGGLGTSQETSEVETIRQIGLWNKMVGFDIHHIGDAGIGGLAPYENIMALSIAVRGRRHTIRQMSASVLR